MAQLLCPVGRLANAVDQVCAYGCPWACGDPDIPDRRPEFGQLGPLLSDCLSALRDRLGWPLPLADPTGPARQARPSASAAAWAQARDAP